MNRNIYAPRKVSVKQQRPVRYNRQILRHFIHTLPVPVCILDRLTGVYLEGNQAYADLLGIKRETLLRQLDSNLPANLGANNFHRILDRLETDRIVRNLEIFIYDLAGALIKSNVRAELVDFDGREAVWISFDMIRHPEPVSSPVSAEARLLAANEVSRELAESCGTDELVNRLAGSIMQLIPDMSTLLISLYDAGSHQLSLVYGQHAGEKLYANYLADLRLDPAGNHLQNEAIHTRQPVIVEASDERLRGAASRLNALTPGKIIQSGLCVPMLAGCEFAGIIQVHSFKANRFHEDEAALLSLIGNAAAGILQTTFLARSLERTSQDLTQTYDASIDGWTRALELRDFSTERHTQRVVSMTMELGRRMGLDEPELLKMKHGAQLHDIGKMGIPDTILLKPGPLDEAEWRVMRKHPVYAYELLRPIPKFSEIMDIPYCHHEKWDGTGYPRRLRGNEIPLSARLFSIVDVWDALSSNRPYRPAWPQHQVFDYIHYQSNKHFEPEITRVFLEIAQGKVHPRVAAPIFRRSTGNTLTNIH